LERYHARLAAPAAAAVPRLPRLLRLPVARRLLLPLVPARTAPLALRRRVARVALQQLPRILRRLQVGRRAAVLCRSRARNEVDQALLW
jgi:hypothetical protein